MTLSDIGDHADIRSGYFGKTMHLSKMADAHLKDCDLMFISQTENGKRQPQLVIEIAKGLQHIVFLS